MNFLINYIIIFIIHISFITNNFLLNIIYIELKNFFIEEFKKILLNN